MRGVVFAVSKGGAPSQPLTAAQVTTADGKSASTDDKGSFTLDELPAGKRSVVSARPSGHTHGLQNVSVEKGETGYVELYVKPVTARATFDAEKGGEVRDPASGASAKFGPGSLVTKGDGAPVKGKVTAELTTIDPKERGDLKALPSTSDARNKDGKAGIVEAFAPMEVRVTDSKGNDLTLKGENQAEIAVPIQSGAKNAAPKARLFSLDEKNGTWRDEGEATKEDASGKPVYRASIAHLSWWNVGTFIDAVSCVRGCVERDGERVSGAFVDVTGIDYAYQAGGGTDADGCFAVDVKRASQVAVVAATADAASALQIVQAGDTEARAADDPAACRDLGVLELTDRDPQNPCAPGYALCTTNGEPAYCYLSASEQDCPAPMSCDGGRCDLDAGMSMLDAGTTDASTPTVRDASTSSDAGLAGFWQFEEKTGPVLDSSGNGLSGTVEASGVTLGVEGKIGSGVAFSGGAIVVPASTLLDFGTGGTIELWVKLSNTESIGSFVSRGTGNNDDNVLLNSSCGNVQAIFSRSEPSGTTSTGGTCNLLTANEFHHVAVVNDGVDLRIYVDAALVETQPGGYMGPIASDLYLGKREGGLFPLSGTLDELKWWTVARTQPEVCADAGGTWAGESCTLP